MTKTIECSACGQEQPATQQDGNFIDYGWSFNWVDAGYYGGFTDPFVDAPSNVSEQLIHLCHQCCVKLLELFPALVEKMQCRRGHPNMNEHDSDNGIATPPCCPYAWTWVRDRSKQPYESQFTEYEATESLTWKKSPVS